MNYLKAYNNLINSRRNLNRDCYLEIHHIVPKGVYGTGILSCYTLKLYSEQERQ